MRSPHVQWASGTVVVLALAALTTVSVNAQPGRGAGAGEAPTPRQLAPVDLTGYWVSIVIEDWRYRMTAAEKGDTGGVPINADGRRVAGEWNPSRDAAAGEACRAYGAPGLMRLPGRLHITWQDDNTLKIDAEAGNQSRLFRFMGAPALALLASGAPELPGITADLMAPSWQGLTFAVWEGPGAGRGRAGPSPPDLNLGNLKAVTTHMKMGYLQKNGVPYSPNAVLTEYMSRTFEPNGDSWLILTSVVEDPIYLNNRYVRSTHFKRLPDNNTTWESEPCSAR